MKVLLIDDHPLIVAALESVLRGMSEGMLVSSATDARSGREALRADPDQDLVLLDLQLGDADGFDLLTEIRATHPQVPVVVISAVERASDVIRAIDLGAMGFVPKRASHGVVLDALRQVIEGGVYVPPMSLIDDPARTAAGTCPSGSGSGSGVAHGAGGLGSDMRHPAPATLGSLGLTPRQTDVLALLLKGLSNKLIARELDVSVETVKDHVAAVLRSLKVASRTQAVIAVSQMLQRASEGGQAERFSAWQVVATR